MWHIRHFVDVWNKKVKKPSNAPDIYPEYDAGDQPTLILQSNCMKAERGNCLRHHQSLGSLLHRPPVATSDNWDSCTEAESHVHSC